jgi:hypothetical protein
MKTKTWGGVLFALFPALALAADQPDCERIQRLCGQAGYTRDLPEGKDLMTKCFKPILQGQQVEGVKIDADTVKNCAAEQKQKTKRGSRRH